MREMADRRLFLNTLDPLLEKLSLEYNNDGDLSDRLHDLFQVPPLLPL
jgi:hypothetical protein